MRAAGTGATAPSASVATTPGPSRPHGGHLVDLILPDDPASKALEDASSWRRITLTAALQSDLELLSVGAYSPLRGFLCSLDFRSVLDDMRLSDGTVWPIPIVLPVDEAFARQTREGERVGLWDAQRLLGFLDVEEIYPYDSGEYARKVYGTDSLEHPGVARLAELGRYHIAGEVHLVRRPDTVAFPEYHLDPIQLRRAFDQRGWRSVVAFQTRNPIHRAHEFIQKCALEIVDGLLVHPLVGETKSDDIPAAVRMRCYEALLAGYYRRENTLLAVFPAVMRYGGPREAIFHALVRKNYGCTHFIVGRDHAGVGNFYGTYDAQKIFARFRPEELGIAPLLFENTFFCRTCGGMASVKTCPHAEDVRVSLSGTKVREMLRRGEMPPAEFSRAEVAKILVESLAQTRLAKQEG